MKDVQQKTLTAGQEETFTMALKRSQFLVKNFTEDSITVKLGNNTNGSVIGAGSWERVFNNIEDVAGRGAEATNIVKVTAVADGMVEVASVDF